MTKEELKELGLSDELANKVVEKYGTMIPKSRFDEINDRMKQAEKDVKDRDSQIESLRKSAGDNEAMKKQIDDLQKANKEAAEKYAADLRQRSRDNSIALALTSKKARNLAAAKSMLAFEDADFDENGELSKTGKAKIDKVVSENAWAFEEAAKPAENQPQKLTGITPTATPKPNDGTSAGNIGATAAAKFLANFGNNNNKQ